MKFRVTFLQVYTLMLFYSSGNVCLHIIAVTLESINLRKSNMEFRVARPRTYCELSLIHTLCSSVRLAGPRYTEFHVAFPQVYTFKCYSNYMQAHIAARIE